MDEKRKDKQIEQLSNALHQSENRNGRRAAEIMRLNDEIERLKKQIQSPQYKIDTNDNSVSIVEPKDCIGCFHLPEKNESYICGSCSRRICSDHYNAQGYYKASQ